ncbi:MULTISPECIES: polysaccharide deacetylase family protein [unclassified Ectothiorhodospira]|uniref:polysaccharide deacetylase family protein n=1 Tax=unclassified Ectothiorhodospira TaxID=2684909 RepID=UPI001EE8D41E|nr:MULTISPECIES: polysaccharide deacetylase family protein [unclassified Ectothiorhodospira]MCG5516872.1 polysaccharide deacetylase family protein [Ectothiorhodospira sp. 9100]MCG5519745.1 polysaccharide deacetylase family protein [Ectothiorhodospira sp. 9905]
MHPLSGLGLRFLRGAIGLLGPAGRHSRLSILIYHRVRPEPDPMLPGDPDAATFRWQVQVVSRLFHVLPLAEALKRLQNGTLPPRAACITFDDGYADNHDVALPLLREQGLPATFFVATGFLDGGMMFNDRILEAIRRMPSGEVDLEDMGLGTRRIDGLDERKALIKEVIQSVKYLERGEREDKVAGLAAQCPQALPDDLMMTTAQLKALDAAGMEIGGHTHSHPILARLTDDQARAEILQGKETLESILGHPVRLFAYPNGKPGSDYLPQHAAMVRECGFEAAVSTTWGVSTRETDPYQLARFTPWDASPGRFGLRLVRNLFKPHTPNLSVDS